ncbi:phage tail protein, partial [Campylobacter sp. faydin G-24]
MQEYYSILTNKGLELLAKAATNQTQIVLSKIGVSDDESDIDQSEVSLKNEKHKFSINSLMVDEADANVLIAEGVINADIGGFYITKAAIYTTNNDIFAIAKLPKTYKPLLTQGSAKDLVIKFIMQVSNSSNITLK